MVVVVITAIMLLLLLQLHDFVADYDNDEMLILILNLILLIFVLVVFLLFDKSPYSALVVLVLVSSFFLPLFFHSLSLIYVTFYLTVTGYGSSYYYSWEVVTLVWVPLL